MITISGQKVTLQEFTAADISDQYISWLNDPVTVRFSNQRFLHHDRQSSRLYLDSFKRTPNIFLSVQESSTKRIVGTMTAYISMPHGTADMGILIGDRARWGKGLGLDAWAALMHWLLAKPNMRKITAGTLDCNTPMLRLMAKSGMTPDGQRIKQEVVDGQPHDLLYFSKFSNA